MRTDGRTLQSLQSLLTLLRTRIKRGLFLMCMDIVRCHLNEMRSYCKKVSDVPLYTVISFTTTE